MRLTPIVYTPDSCLPTFFLPQVLKSSSSCGHLDLIVSVSPRESQQGEEAIQVSVGPYIVPTGQTCDAESLGEAYKFGSNDKKQGCNSSSYTRLR